MKRTRVNALDVGTTKICTLMADIDESGLPRIIGVGIAPSRGLQKGVVVDYSEARKAIRESIDRAEQISGSRMDSAIVGVTGKHIASENNRGVVAITRDKRVVRRNDLERVQEVARNINVPPDRELLHVIPRSYAVDGQDKVDNPVGMHGFRLDIEAHMITASVTSVRNLAKCISSVGVEIKDMVLEPLASAESVLTDEERQRGVLLADIGGGTTDIAIFKNESIFHTSVLPVAGYQFSHDLAVGLEIPYEQAEDLKKRYGDVMPVSGSEKDRDVNEYGQAFSYHQLSDILRLRAEELLRLIRFELPQQDVRDYSDFIPSGIVLTGGSSNILGIAELGGKVTRLPVRLGTPFNLYGIADSLCDPAYATAVGLLLWKRDIPVEQNSWKQKTGLKRYFSDALAALAK